MLLYVDKKKLKRRKIKIVSITLSCFLILLANIICLKNSLHQTNKSLTSYEPLQITQDWYNNTDVVTTFSEQKSKQIKAILIPQIINRENALTIALAFSKLPPNHTNLIFADDIKEKAYLQRLGTLFTQSSADTAQPNDIIITNNINNITFLISKQKLSPHTINYKQTAKLQNLPALQKLLNQQFPPTPQPQTEQEKQQQAIQNFAKTYRTDLQNLIHASSSYIAFSTRNLILQNLGICLSTAEKTICSIRPDNSLQQNIRIALINLHHQAPQKLFLLTTPEEIPVNAILDADDGILFHYGSKEAFILPQKRGQYPNNTNIYAYLKQQAGLNPDYHTPDMKFYKFKTTEIDINDKI